MNLKGSGIFEVPGYPGFGIDKSYNIYVFNDNMEIERKIKYTELKFIYESKTFYISDLIGISFYGIENYQDFKDPIRMNDDLLIINGIEFKKIPDFLDGYYISNFGAIYSTYSNRLRKQEIDDDGYHRISFPYNNLTHIAIHRIVYKTWVGKIKDGMVIDHKDNCKWNNKYSNLQEVTAKQNSRMAAEDGLYNTTFVWTEEKVHEVCKLMEKNVTVKDIAAKFNIYPSDKRLYKNFRNQLSGFRKNTRSWIDITSKYDLSNYDGAIRPDSKYKDSEIILMRKMYSEGKSINEIAKSFNTEPTAYFSKLIRGLKRKKIKINV